MPPQGPNPFVYIFPAVLLVAAVLYFAYGAVDRTGLTSFQTEAQVTGKQHTPVSTTYITERVAGQTMTRPRQNPEAYVLALKVGNDETGGAVSKQLYDSLKAGDRVHVTARRTRISKRILITDVSR